MDLDSMKYAELRALAKELGLKANLKADKLLKLIKQHYEDDTMKKEQEEQGRDPDAAVEPEDVKAEGDEAAAREKTPDTGEEVSGAAAFVNTRRGRGKSVKRKMSDAAGDERPRPTPAEDDVGVDADPLPRGEKGPKKRRVSFVKDPVRSESEAPAENRVADAEQQRQDDAAPVHRDAEKATKASNPGRIPRFRGTLPNKKPLKPVTPNFKKLHEAHFNKLESIDSYLQRKSKQVDSYKAPVKELKKPSDRTKAQPADGKARAQTNQSASSLFSPAPLEKKTSEDKRRRTRVEAGGKDEVPFRPSVLSTRRINVRFSEATRDNEHKRSLVKTPSRMSLSVTSSTPLKPAAEAKSNNNNNNVNKTFPAAKTPGTFVFTGNTSTTETPGTQKKPTFDLKASLSRPLAYKPHKGKLKPFADVKQNATAAAAAAANKSVVSDSHQTNYKQHQVQTRDHRRERHAAGRKQKKENMLGARRGLVMM